MSVFPVNRVPDILKRMDLNSSQAEAMKTCFGILAIMSREDTNKLLIAKDGMDIILNAMTIHIDRTDVQESGCDLLWSLAFNSTAVKEIIAKHGGATVLVKALKRHSRSADFLKSACGALSNMCQCKLNQEGVSSQGGLQPLVGSIHIHQTSAKLLPFVFDAIASIIVNNEDNARSVSSLGLIPVVVASLSRHKLSMEVVKSGCHTLAILSDVKGQASKIAFAGGVPIILSLLDAHPLYSDLHRVAAVVLLRMLQESAHVGREITCHEGVRILLNSLEKGGAQQDTVAAVTHILYTVTNPSSPASAAVESQLWLPHKGGPGGTSSTPTNVVEEEAGSELNKKLTSGLRDSPVIGRRAIDNGAGAGAGHSPVNGPATALGGVVLILGQYASRRDVVRAACRLINNLSGYPNVVISLDRLHLLDKMLECVHIHKDTKDVVDSTCSVIKAIYKKTTPYFSASTSSSTQGMLQLFKAKLQDEDFVLSCVDIFIALVENAAKLSMDKKKDLDAIRSIEGRPWEFLVLNDCLLVLRWICDGEVGDSSDIVTVASSTSLALTSPNSNQFVTASSSKGGISRPSWTKVTVRMLGSILQFIELICIQVKCISDQNMIKEVYECLLVLAKALPTKHIELIKRLDKLMPNLEARFRKDKLAGNKRSPIANRESTLTVESALDGLSMDGSAVTAAGLVVNGECGVVSRSAPSSDESGGGGSAFKSAIRNSTSSLPSAGSRQNDVDGVNIKPWSADTTPGGGGSVLVKSEHGHSKSAFTSHNNESSSGKKLFPQHPTKSPQASRLLVCWPNYLERLLLSSTNGVNNRMFQVNQTSAESNRMHCCYESVSAGGRGLMSKCSTPVPYVVPPQGIGEPFDHSLTFDSDFESGNLLRAVQKGDATYDLFLRSDLHTQGHTQWFYFAVANTHPADLVRLYEQGVQVPPVRVRFNLVNFTKPDSLFNLGMRPVVYSCLDAATKGTGWVRAGSDISYYGNTYVRGNTAGEGLTCYYTLSFTIEFHNPKDTMLIAYSYPFTMSDYRHHIKQILDRPKASDVIRQSRLCQTLAGDDCDLLVITNFKDKDKDRIGPVTVASVESRFEDNLTSSASVGGKQPATGRGSMKESSKKNQQPLKPALFLSSRVHPGETPASWMMKGILEFLTSDCSQAQLLRQVFVIFIVPMLNPDGVTYGNNRCSLAGVDLNRQWKAPLKQLHPTVYYLKSFMGAQRKIRDVSMYIDLHGHSRKYNVFMYGCDDKKRPKPQVRAFPKFFSLHNIGKKYVSFADCSFHVKKGRESTARVVVAKDLNIPCSFTLEATFCGSNYGPLKHCHMNIGHMQEVGAALCDAFLNFSIAEGQVKDVIVIPNTIMKPQVETFASEGSEDLNEGLNGGFSVADDEGEGLSMKSSGRRKKSNGFGGNDGSNTGTPSDMMINDKDADYYSGSDNDSGEENDNSESDGYSVVKGGGGGVSIDEDPQNAASAAIAAASAVLTRSTIGGGSFSTAGIAMLGSEANVATGVANTSSSFTKVPLIGSLQVGKSNSLKINSKEKDKMTITAPLSDRASNSNSRRADSFKSIDSTGSGGSSTKLESTTTDIALDKLVLLIG